MMMVPMVSSMMTSVVTSVMTSMVTSMVSSMMHHLINHHSSCQTSIEAASTLMVVMVRIKVRLVMLEVRMVLMLISRHHGASNNSSDKSGCYCRIEVWLMLLLLMLLRRSNDDNSLGLLWSRVKSLIYRRLLKTWIWHLVVKKKIKIFNTDNLSILYILLLFLKFLICIHPGKGYWPVASLTVCVLQKKWRVRLATR
jgi:hypothetical protein